MQELQLETFSPFRRDADPMADSPPVGVPHGQRLCKVHLGTAGGTRRRITPAAFTTGRSTALDRGPASDGRREQGQPRTAGRFPGPGRRGTGDVGQAIRRGGNDTEGQRLRAAAILQTPQHQHPDRQNSFPVSNLALPGNRAPSTGVSAPVAATPLVNWADGNDVPPPVEVHRPEYPVGLSPTLRRYKHGEVGNAPVPPHRLLHLTPIPHPCHPTEYVAKDDVLAWNPKLALRLGQHNAGPARALERCDCVVRTNTKWEPEGKLAYEGCNDAAHYHWASRYLNIPVAGVPRSHGWSSACVTPSDSAGIDLSNAGNVQAIIPNPIVLISPLRTLPYSYPTPSLSIFSTGQWTRTPFDGCVQKMQAQHGVWYNNQRVAVCRRWHDYTNIRASGSCGILPSCGSCRER